MPDDEVIVDAPTEDEAADEGQQDPDLIGPPQPPQR